MTEQYRFRITPLEALAIIGHADTEPEAAWLWVQERLGEVNRRWPRWDFTSWIEGDQVVVEVRER